MARWCFLINQPSPRNRERQKSHFYTTFEENYNPDLEATLWLTCVATAESAKIPLPADSSCRVFGSGTELDGYLSFPVGPVLCSRKSLPK